MAPILGRQLQDNSHCHVWGGAISVRVRIQKSGKVPQWIDILQMAGPISD